VVVERDKRHNKVKEQTQRRGKVTDMVKNTCKHKEKNQKEREMVRAKGV
jgi:hypothetical protein